MEDISTADLKAKHLLANAAPASLWASDDDPPLGNVRDTVEVEEPSSVATIKPLESLVMSVLPALEGVGVVLGRLQQEEKGSVTPNGSVRRKAALSARRCVTKYKDPFLRSFLHPRINFSFLNMQCRL